MSRALVEDQLSLDGAGIAHLNEESALRQSPHRSRDGDSRSSGFGRNEGASRGTSPVTNPAGGIGKTSCVSRTTDIRR